MKVLFVPHSCQNLICLLNFCRSYGSIVVSICVSNSSSIITNDFEYHFMCLFAVPNVFVSEVSIQICCPFKTLRCLSSFIELYNFLNIVDTGHLLDMCIINIFSQSMTCLFISLLMSFKGYKCLTFMESNLLIF